ncbi:MAG: hypothetical protein RL265_830 [Bacteroidota bacterium]
MKDISIYFKPVDQDESYSDQQVGFNIQTSKLGSILAHTRMIFLKLVQEELLCFMYLKLEGKNT